MDDNTEVTGWSGWVTFAALFMIFEGIVNFLYGMGAILNAHWFVYASGTTYLIDTTSWGWWMLFVGMLLAFSGSLLMTGNWFGRTMGVIFATVSLLVNLAVFPVAPIWSTIAIVLDILVIYAVVAHGSEMKVLARH